MNENVPDEWETAFQNIEEDAKFDTTVMSIFRAAFKTGWDQAKYASFEAGYKCGWDNAKGISTLTVLAIVSATFFVSVTMCAYLWGFPMWWDK